MSHKYAIVLSIWFNFFNGSRFRSRLHAGYYPQSHSGDKAHGTKPLYICNRLPLLFVPSQSAPTHCFLIGEWPNVKNTTDFQGW
ncbi:MAG: hypothetical protein QGG39_17265, partial [Candidatus Poribacteria bacterium]|nr:hypothetical protein [Candidatus Poribacteria bacterium]